MTDKPSFGGYKWEGILFCYRFEETKAFHDSINWEALCQYASKLNNNKPCTMDPHTTMGGRNLIRVIVFNDGSRWIVRFRIPSGHVDEFGTADSVLKSEVDCMQLVRERTSVPVPTVFGYNADPKNHIGGSFILMECLPGNAVVNLQHSVPMSPEQRTSLYGGMARFQAEISSITFPKIGSLARSEDGTWEIGPLPVLGGPFDTVTEYLEAWADTAYFGDLKDLEKTYGEDLGSRLKTSIRAFPPGLKRLAATVPIRNRGPFPLIHSDFAYWNVVVDDDYKVLGVIDWEFAHSGPWETVHFPSCFMPTPAPMCPTEWYDDDSMPKDPDLERAFREMDEYVDVVRQVEQSKDLPPTLSAVLSDRAGQDLALAMKLYSDDGKDGYYSNILEKHSQRWGGGSKELRAAQR